jgi:hypothetical protein
VFSAAALSWAAEFKRVVDPGNLFGISNQAMSLESDRIASATGRPRDD